MLRPIESARAIVAYWRDGLAWVQWVRGGCCEWELFGLLKERGIR